MHFECDTPDCIHSEDGICVEPGAITIQEHHCVDYEERALLPAAGTVTIEVNRGVVQNVYASPDLPAISDELIDFDNLKVESEQAQARGERLLNLTVAGSEAAICGQGRLPLRRRQRPRRGECEGTHRAPVWK